ncbi:MAG: PAS domain-containing protein [Methanospirillaceae archaeon]|nr:PAS domain-containing protein [Methanospirillaceae archaeon]
MNHLESAVFNKADYIIENNPAAILFLDKKLNIVSANLAFLSLSGYRRETLETMNVRSFQVLSRDNGSFEDVIRDKKTVCGSCIVQFPSGKRYLNYQYLPVPDSRGEIEEIVAVFIDKTREQHDIERAVSIIGKSPVATCIFNRELQITSVNEAFLQLSGYKREDLIRKPLSLFQVIERSGARPVDAIEKKTEFTTELVISFPSGMRYLSGIFTPICDERGEVSEVIEFFTDCTQEKEMARKILAVAGNARRGDFSGRIALDELTGTFADIASEMNSMLDSVADPLQEIVRVSGEYAKGEFTARFSDTIGVDGYFVPVHDALNNIGSSVHTSLKELSNACDSYAMGDFTYEFPDTITKASGFTSIRKSLLQVGTSMRSALSLISKQTTILADIAENAGKNVIHVSEGAGMVAKSADEVKNNTERCQLGIKQILSAMEDLSIAVDGVAQKVEKAANFTADTNHLCKKGEDLTRTAEAGIAGITHSTSEVDAMIQEIKNQMAKIDTIVLLITEISNQTNLLALNAAIEAARAGDAGRGFAVVATEVKSLAQESKSSAEEITDLIRSLQSTSERAELVMKDALTEVEKGGGAVNESMQVFSKVIFSVNEISNIMEEIAVASEEQAAGVEEITASVSEVKHYVEETTLESDRTAAASRESSQATDSIADTIQDIEQAISAVTTKIQEFKYS